MNRRGFLSGLMGLLAAPAIVRASAIMPVSVLPPARIRLPNQYDLHAVELSFSVEDISRQALMMLHQKCDFLATVVRQYESAFERSVGLSVGDQIMMPARA